MSEEQKIPGSLSFFDQNSKQTFDSTAPEDGIGNVKIDAFSTGHIPGMIEHWHQEIKHRKQEILEFESRSSFERIINLFTSDEEYEDVTGEDLVDLHPSKKAQSLLEKIEAEPTDMMNRLELVSYLGLSGREFPLEVYRDLFLQATVACCFGELSNVGLRIVLWAQESYFVKHLALCKKMEVKLEKFLEQPDLDDVFRKQRVELIKSLNKVKQNKELLQFYKSFTNRGIKNLTTSLPISMSLEEINQLLLRTPPPQTERKNRTLQKSLSPAVGNRLSPFAPQ
ncbi:MAG: hypothetical protein HQM13_13425 [SAR324 cluster bacterium]|nr:hypothetical protein [SAR324 cluster bacterium]